MKAITKYYLGYFLEISHSIDNNRENAHEHTVEVNLTISIGGKMATNWIDSIDRLLKKEFMVYDGAYLNDLKEFNGDATIEGLGEVLWSLAERILESRDIVLHRLSIGETPLREYVITDKT